MARKKMGAPSKFTPETIAKFLDTIRKGNFRETACKVAGISYRAFRDWFNRGTNEGSGPYYDFAQAVQDAESEVESRAVDRIVGSNDVKHVIWWLQTKYPERWGTSKRLIHDMYCRIKALEKALATGPAPPPAPPGEETPGDDDAGETT